MVFNKKQQNILKRAFGQEIFSIDFEDKIRNISIYHLNKKLNKIGYRLKLELKGDRK